MCKMGLILSSIFLVNITLFLLRKLDMDKVIKKFDKKECIRISILILIPLLLFAHPLLKLNNSKYVVTCILTSYLILTSYIDYKSKLVYSIVNQIVVVVGIGILLRNSFAYNTYNSILYVIIFGIISTIFTKIGCYGDGDNEIYIIVAIYFSVLGIGGDLPLIVFLYLMVISITLMLIMNIKLLDIKKMQLRKSVAFAPYITVTTFLLMLILFVNQGGI